MVYNGGMYVKRAAVRGFRNLVPQTIEFEPGINVLFGANAQGKTNILESICLVSRGKSPRTDREKEMICHGGESASVRAEFLSFLGGGCIEMKLSKKEGKRILLNDMPVRKTGEILGCVNTVFFSPDELKIIKRSPEERRRFLDIDLCQLDKNYYYSLLRYNRALMQRNSLLKRYQDMNALKEVLCVWDGQVVKEGVRLVLKRREFCETLKPLAEQTHGRITDGEEQLVLDYKSDLIGADAGELAECFLRALQSGTERQQKLGYTPFGPHRDDVRFLVGGTDIRAFGSQGQQRTAALALKFAEAELFKARTGDYPVLLLDDVLSELDEKRQRRLFEFSDKMQTVVTTAEENEIMKKPEAAVIGVEGGRTRRL